MTPTQAQIKAAIIALRGDDPDMLRTIQPIGWLYTAIQELKNPEKILESYREDIDAWWMMVRELEWIYEKGDAALTAAAEAGEQREPDEMCLRVGHKWVIECQRCGDNRTVQSEIIATIERCAQVADKYKKNQYGFLAEMIAAAIRALKGQP